MKIFTNKSVIHKIIVVLIILLLFNFIVPNHTRADDGLGGALLTPILDFLVAIGDGIVWLLQNAMFGMNDSLIHISFAANWWEWLAVIGAALGAALLVVTVGVLTFGLGVPVTFGAIVTLVALTGATGGIVGYCVGKEVLPDDLYLPTYIISPYEIFSNSIPTFDVNFFDPQGSVTYHNGNTTREEVVEISVGEKITVSPGGGEPQTYYRFTQSEFDQFKSTYGFSENGNATGNTSSNMSGGQLYAEYKWTNSNDGKTYIAWKCNVSDLYNTMDYDYMVSNMREIITEEITTEVKSTAGELRNIVSGWYYALRNLALVGLLSVLVYIGIRIVISSTANEKAKYKSMIMDWIIAMCLLFFLHYIMAFSVKIVEKITDALASVNDENITIVYIQDDADDENGHIAKGISGEDEGANTDLDYFIESGKAVYVKKGEVEPGTTQTAEHSFLKFNTNEMGAARVNYQVEKGENSANTLVSKISYCIIFLVLIAYTFIFSFTYLKRVLYMAFLTLIAPLVALTYPIDKVNDGQAQAFNTWFKEYIFNLLIQPMHLILYTILIGTAFEFASKNMLYTIVALGFMVPAEKLLRRFFGFEKAHTPGALAGPAGAALMMTGMQNLLRKPPKKHDEEDGKGSGGSKSTNKIRSAETINPMETLAAKNGENNNNDDNQDKKINMSETNPGLDSGSDETNANPSTKDQNPGRIRMNLTNNGAENNPPHSLEEAPQESPSQLRFKDTNNEPTTDPTKIDTSNPANVNPPNVNPPKVNPPKTNPPKTIKNPSGGNRRKLPDLATKKDKKEIPKESNLKNAAKATARGFRNAGYYYTRKLGNKVRKSHPIRTIRRAGTAAIGGAAMGTLGLVAGIASGDPSKAMQYAATGALAGGKFAKSAGDAIASSSKGGAKAFKQGVLGDQYLEKEQEKLIKEFSRDQKNVDYLMERGYAPKQIRTILNDVAPEYLSEGINDMDDILTGYKLEQGDQANGYEEMDRDEAISTIKMANRLGDTRKSAKAEKEWGERLTKDYKNIDQVQNYYNTDEYKQEQDKIRADYEEKIKKLEKQKMSDAQRKQKMEEAKAKRDAMLKEHEDAPASKLANDTIARARRVYDIKDNI